MSPELFDFVAGDTPLLISMPHSATHLPPPLAARMTTAALDLPDTDWFVPELYAFCADLGASVIRATHSRYVVDLNRPPDGAPLYPGRRETALCPMETFAGEPIYRPDDAPSRAEIEERLHHYWQPYHRRLAAAIDALVLRHGRCLLWDAHSILSSVPGLFAGRLPDLNVGTADGSSCSPAIQDRIVAELSAQERFTYVVDGRFKGGYITRHYGNPQSHVDAVQLEIAQAAYMFESPTPTFDAALAEPLSSLLRRLLAAVT